MKNTMLVFATCILMQAAAYAQKGACSLAGKLKPADIVTPLHINNEEGVQLSIPVEADGTFRGKFTIPAKGFYTVTDIGNIYLEPGYDLQIAYAPDSTYRFTGKGALENNAFVTAYKSLYQYMPVSPETVLGQETFYLPIPVFLEKLGAFVAGGKQLFEKSNSDFFRQYAGKDLEFYAKFLQYTNEMYYGIDLAKQHEFYQFFLKGGKPDSAYLKKYHELDSAQHVKRLTAAEKTLLKNNYLVEWDKSDAALYKQSPWYRYMYSRHVAGIRRSKYYHVLASLGENDDDRRDLLGLTVIQQEVTEPFILEHLRHEKVINSLKFLASKQLRDSLYNSYIATVKRTDYRKDAESVYANAITFADNGTAPDFTYEDINGKMIALRDLRGRYVYIDVWATWCAPCKAEIPHLEKVEQAFHGKNITFVSLSVDKKADKGKWADFVKKGTLSSIQVLADKAFDSDFIQKFNINSIPRFILIAPDGKIVSANALRPSDPELVAMLEKLLKG